MLVYWEYNRYFTSEYGLICTENRPLAALYSNVMVLSLSDKYIQMNAFLISCKPLKWLIMTSIRCVKILGAYVVRAPTRPINRPVSLC